MSSSSPSLLDRFRRACRRRQFSRHTEQSYRRWVIRYVRFHDTTHPRDLDVSDVRAVLPHLATTRNVAAATQNQALNALVFLYDEVLAPTHSNGNTPTPRRPGPGTTCFPPPNAQPIRTPEKPSATTAPRRLFSAPSDKPLSTRISQNGRPVTPSATHLRPTCYKTAKICGGSRSCWGTST